MAEAEPSSKMCPPRASTETGEDCSTSSRLYIFPRQSAKYPGIRMLTVAQGQAGAHQGKGWETFTDRVIETVNREREGVVFLLWGGYARKKGRHIDRDRHLVLEGPHPSPHG